MVRIRTYGQVSTQTVNPRCAAPEIIYRQRIEDSVCGSKRNGRGPAGGSVGAYQHIVCDPTSKEKCLVAIAVALSKWWLGIPMKLQLLPDAVVRCIRPYMNRKGFRCSYRVFKGGVESAPKKTSVGSFQILLSPTPQFIHSCRSSRRRAV